MRNGRKLLPGLIVRDIVCDENYMINHVIPIIGDGIEHIARGPWGSMKYHVNDFGQLIFEIICSSEMDRGKNYRLVFEPDDFILLTRLEK